MTPPTRLKLWLAATLASLLGALLTRAPEPEFPSGIYLDSQPRGATVKATVQTLQGLRQLTLGKTPSALQAPEHRPLACWLELPGYHNLSVELPKPSHGVQPTRLSLTPRLPILVPAFYYARNCPFQVSTMLLVLAFYPWVLAPWRNQRRHQRVLQELFRHGKVEPGTEIERYTILAKIGEGGMAAVFRVRLSETGPAPELALKLLKPELGRWIDYERFLAETALLRKLQHPHLIAYADHGEHLGQPFVVMELLRGRGLDQRILSELDWPKKHRMLSEVAAALVYLHENGLVHRDLKPSNIFLREDGKAVLMDLGIARQMNDSPLRQGPYVMKSVAGEVMGTPGYMSPEQLSGAPVDWRSDLYSLALLALETVTGQPPYGRGHPAEVLARQMHQPRPPFPEPEAFPVEGLRDLLWRWSDPDPLPRAHSMRAAYAELVELASSAARTSVTDA